MQWKSKFESLKQYKSEHNHCNVPRREGGLGTWVRSQRTAFKENKPSDEQKEMLNSAGFVWTVDFALGCDMQWKSMFDALKQYKSEYNH